MLYEIQRVDFVGAMQYLADFYNEKLEFVYEQNDEKAQAARKERDDASVLIRKVVRTYSKNLNEKPSNAARAFVAQRGLEPEDLAEWGIGFAEDDFQGITNPIKERGLLKVALKIGIVSEKNSNQFDFLRNRITFPIADKRGNFVGIAGRILSDEKPKFLNPKESFIYNKSNVLYGLHSALGEISKTGVVFITEGYMDVISSQKAGLINTVASCGTALNHFQLKLLPKDCKRVVLMFDGDKAGIKATKAAIKLCQSIGLKISVCQLPDGKDADDYFNEGGTVEQIEEFIIDGYQWLFEEELSEAHGHDKEIKIEELVGQVAMIGSDLTRDGVVKTLAKAAGEKLTIIRKMVAEAVKTYKIKAQREVGKKAVTLGENMTYLPKGCDRDLYDIYGFTRDENQYHFFMSDDWQAVTNFVIEPLFHIRDNDNDQRLFLLKSFGKEELVAVRSEDIISFSKMAKELTIRGNYQFSHRFQDVHYRRLVNYLLNHFPMAFLISTLGQQIEGFYAYANGIAYNGEFFKVDRYGMVDFKDCFITGSGEKKEEDKKFFLPAYSEIFKDVRSDNDEYENERKMMLKESPISLEVWQDLFIRAFGEEKALIGIAFTFATCFRDLFIKSFQSFPILQCYGEKGSGKSAFSSCIENFFFVGQQPFMLNTGTEVGFFRRLSRVMNAAIFFDEYTDDLDNKRFQALKSGWNGVGREKGRFSNDKRTITDKVNGSLIVGGQYISARDDFSLTTRSILLEFVRVDDRPEDQIDAFRELKEAYSSGLNSLVMPIVEHRDHFKKEFAKEYQEINTRIRIELREHGADDRAISNYGILLATIKILSEKIKLKFSFEDFYTLCVAKIKKANDVLSDGEALSIFWSIIQDLHKTRIISEDQEYIIEENPNFVKVWEEGSEKRIDVKHLNRILYMRIESVVNPYLKEYRRIYSESGLRSTNLKGYLKSRSYCIGAVQQKKINGRNSSCFAFDYDQLQKEFGLYLEANLDGSHPSKKTAPEPNESDDAKLPF